MEEKDIWSEKVLNSLENMQRAKPRADLFDEILQNIHTEPRVKTIRMEIIRIAAVAAFGLLMLNLYSIYSKSTFDQVENSTEINSHSIISNYSLYKN